MKQIASMRYRIKKTNHNKALHVSREYLDYEQAHPEIFNYNRTRYYFRDASENSDEEEWMFIDWFDDYQTYLNSLDSAQEKDPEAQRLRKQFMSVVVPGSLTHDSREQWTEAEELRVDFPGTDSI